MEMLLSKVSPTTTVLLSL